MLPAAAKRASRTPLQVAAMGVVALIVVLWVLRSEFAGAATLFGLPLFGLLMFLGARPGRG